MQSAEIQPAEIQPAEIQPAEIQPVVENVQPVVENVQPVVENVQPAEIQSVEGENDPIKIAMLKEADSLQNQLNELKDQLMKDTTLTPETATMPASAGGGLNKLLKKRKKTFYKRYKSKKSMKRRNKTNRNN
jgi:hypothetical protein